MLNRRVVEFPRLTAVPAPRPVKAALRPDVQGSVQRSIDKLPVLGQRNPDAALLIERSIDDWMPPPDGDDGQTQTETVIARGTRSPEAEYIHRLQAGYQWTAEDQTIEQRQHRCLIDMLCDMHRDLSVAS
jgi:hypothetical protein